MSVNQTAEAEGISTEYAGKLMGVLVRAGLVDSVRGRYGGYRLARPASDITLVAALTALGGKFYEAQTCDRFSGDHSACVHSAGCSIRSVWSGLQMIFDHVLTRTSLADVITHSEHSMTEWVRAHAEALTSFEIPTAEHGLDKAGSLGR